MELAEITYRQDSVAPHHQECFVPYELKVKLEAFDLMFWLEGWCSREKMSVLIDLIFQEKLENLVEIGVFAGKSLLPMAYALKMNGKGKIFGIDPWDVVESVRGIENIENRIYWGMIDHEAIYSELIQKIDQFNLKDQVVLFRNTSQEASSIEQIDLLHIDGNHSKEASYLDVVKWTPLVRRGGFIVFNDITWSENGVCTMALAISWLDSQCEKVKQYQTDGSVWGIWRKL